MRKSYVVGLIVTIFIPVAVSHADEVDLSKPLTLSECIALAMERNAQIRSAERQFERSEADVLAAWSSVLPNVNATAFGFGRFTTGPSVRVQETPVRIDSVTLQPVYEQKEVVFKGSSRNSYSFSASLSQTIYDGGRSRHGIRQARSGKRAAAYSLTWRKEGVKLDVQRQYYGLLKAQKLVAVQEEAVARSQKQLEKTESLLAIGSGIEADVLRSKVALGNERIALINMKNNFMRAKADLKNTLGLDMTTQIEVADRIDPPRSLPEFQKATDEAMSRNPDIRRITHELRAAESGVAVARSAYLPRIGASVSYGRNGEEIDRVYNQLDKNYQVNISTSLTYNIFDGFSKRANLNRATASMLAAMEDLEQTKRTITLAVQKAFLELDRTRQVAEINRENIASAEEDLRLAEERYRVGTGTLLEVIDAQVNFTRAKVNSVQAEYDLKIAEAELENAMGGWGE